MREVWGVSFSQRFGSPGSTNMAIAGKWTRIEWRVFPIEHADFPASYVTDKSYKP